MRRSGAESRSLQRELRESRGILPCRGICVAGGERAACAGGRGGELLAEGAKQGRSEGGNRKIVMPLQSEEFSWAKIQLK